MRIVLHREPRLGWQLRYTEYFVKGLVGAGHDVTVTESRHAAAGAGYDLLLGCNCWHGVQNECAEAGKPYLMVNRAFWGDPDAVAIGWNGFNGHALYAAPIYERQAPMPFKVAVLAPWTSRNNKYVVVMGQMQAHTLAWPSLSDWYADAATQADTAYPGFPIVFRPHPADGAGCADLEAAPHTRLQDVLAAAAAVITLNSTVAVEAILAGVPTVVMDVGGVAYPLGALQGPAAARPGEQGQPQRTRAWLQRLAWAQWRAPEIEAGMPWPHLLDAGEPYTRPQRAWPA